MGSNELESIKGVILIVDDEPDNLQVLSSMLNLKGYKVRKAINGHLAVTAARINPPDIILLDILMPDIDGYQVCSLLKADERTCDIPVIFLSAFNEPIDKLIGFKVGGVDYITKPYQLEEVLARVENQLSIRRLSLQLLDRNRQLVEENQKLQEKLCDRTTAEVALRKLNQELTGISNVYGNTFQPIQRAVQSLICLVDNVLFLVQEPVEEEVLKPIPLDLVAFCCQIVEELQPPASKSQTIQVTYQGTFLQKEWDEKVLRQILTHLLSNAINYSPNGGIINFQISGRDDEITLQVKDQGIGIPSENQARLFEPFYRGSNVGTIQGMGLGLSIVKKCVDLYNGEIEVESEVGVGTTFTVHLPVANTK